MSDTNATISSSIWWIIPTKLAGLRKPSDLEEISELRAQGIGALVSLMDDDEVLELYRSASIDHLWLPIKGGTVPTTEQIANLKTYVDEKV